MIVLQQLLPQTPIGPNDNFFDVGLHSLLLIRFLKQCRDRFAIDVKISDAYEHSTPAAFAVLVEGRVDRA
jgi:aryl carrier-like protein